MGSDIIDICNEDNDLLGISKLKSLAHKEGLWHRAVHIWVYTSKGEILLQLRAKDRELYPDMWDTSASGHVIAGEKPIGAAVREMAEEIGLSADKSDLEFFKIMKHKGAYKSIINNEFYYIYFYKLDKEIKKLKFSDEEVQAIKFLPIEKLEEELKENPGKYVPHGDYWLKVIEYVKSRTN